MFKCCLGHNHAQEMIKVVKIPVMHLILQALSPVQMLLWPSMAYIKSQKCEIVRFSRGTLLHYHLALTLLTPAPSSSMVQALG